jgi:hypothetical protein
MALVHLDTLTDLTAWTITQSPAGVSSVAGRTGNATRITYQSTWTVVQYIMPAAAEHAVIAIGMAVKPHASLASGSAQIMLTLKSDAAATEHVHVCYNANKWLVKRAPNTNVSGPSTVSVVAGNWSFIEIICTLGTSTGTVLMRQNGVEVLNSTGLNTKNGGIKSTFDSVWLWIPAATSGLTLDYADVWIATATDPGLGDCQTMEFFPSGDGVFPGGANQWLGSDGDSVSNYLLVDEAGTPTADSVHTTTSGARDIYTMGDPTITSGYTVKAVDVTGHLSTVSGTGSAQLALANVDGTSSLTSAAIPVTTTAKSLSGVFTTAADGSLWTPAKVNAMQAGVVSQSTADTTLSRLKAVVASAAIVDLGALTTRTSAVAGGLTAGFPLKAGWDVGWNE